MNFPGKPEEPLQSDCCGTGCTPCVFDIYEEDVKLWEAECRRIKLCQTNQQIANHDSDVLNPSEYRKFLISDITKVSKDTYLFKFKLPEYQSLGLKVGEHIILRSELNGKMLSRQYTPISDSSTEGYFEILIKLYDNGKMSKIIKKWEIGSETEWRGPFGNLSYKPNHQKKIVLLAAGTGIAPMIQIIRHIVSNDDDYTLVQLFFACRTFDDLIGKTYLDEWSDFWNFTVCYVLSKDSEEIVKNKKRYSDRIHYGRIDESFLMKEVGVSEENRILICGTKSFDKDMIKHLKKNGYKQNQLFKF